MAVRKWLRRIAWAVVLVVLVAALLWPAPFAQAVQLPLLLLFSLARMVAAYLLALVFAIAYGTTAATNKRAATVLLPVLDVLQSVPILGFFPAVVLFFVDAFSGSPVGLEIAVVVLIFTSMAWNMAFGVYEALTTVPHDLEDAGKEFGLTGWLRFRRLALPATIPKLVYNSILSWTNGWFFLVASEVFTAYGATYVRPGIGSFLADAGARGDAASIGIGLVGLAATVLIVDAIVWRPLSGWSERFRLEPLRGEKKVPLPYEPFRWIPRIPGLWHRLAVRLRRVSTAYEHTSARLDRVYTSHPRALRAVRRVDLAMFLVIFVVVVTAGLIGLVGLLFQPLPEGAAGIPQGALFSFLRLLVAYLIALGWTLPVAAYVGRHPRAGGFLTPAFEVFASLPATALLPVIVGFSLAVAGSIGNVGAELAALLVALFSMQWYLLFNLIGGVRNIPADLDEAARAFGVRGRMYWRRVLLPAVVPSLLTGSITAWGAGWNALIVSEYFQYAGAIHGVHGLGNLMDVATFGTPTSAPNSELLLLTILTMIVLVLAMNKLLWHRLLRRASVRYRLEVA